MRVDVEFNVFSLGLFWNKRALLLWIEHLFLNSTCVHYFLLTRVILLSARVGSFFHLKEVVALLPLPDLDGLLSMRGVFNVRSGIQRARRGLASTHHITSRIDPINSRLRLWSLLGFERQF